ncbi:hypothetical protein like AT1G20180 [Hibiscus trionum]|uniref:Uncharacterized protein n=1 Tax=Hibiscus trionum TaxID=183268 RepID=A0A9W7HUX7_HIBTR|nr:hypothetical protein like AT1G20180 [Hibiscus trionum]
MWAKFRVFKVKGGEKELRDARKSLNVNDEYLSTLRTKSYLEFSSKAQILANEPSSPYKFFQLLEPCQDTVSSVLESAILSEIPELKTLILDYFDITAEASRICGQLLVKINRIRRNYQFIQRALDSLDDHYHSPEKFGQILSELNSFIALKNPFSNPNKHDFETINEQYSSILHHLKSNKRKVSRKIKMIKFIHKASGICLTTACGLIVTIAIVLAVHTLAPLLMTPAILSFVPVKLLKKKKMMIFKKLPCLKCGFLRKVGDQLDVAAKGTYILNRDFDTMSRLVSRLNDEVEHKKEIIRICLERQREDHRFCQQIVKELRKCDAGFLKQVQELEEHVYLCLVTINRARALVIKEMTASLLV